MVWSFLVICFESNAYRNIIKCVETAWTYTIFSSKVIRKWEGSSWGSTWLWISCLNEWEAPPQILGRKVYLCIETRPNCLFGRKSQNSFLCPLFCSWEWIKFLESPCEEWRQELSEFLMAPLSEGMLFFQLFGLDLRALNISLFFVFLLPCPLSFPFLWKAEVQLFLIACLKLSWVLCFWTWPNDYSLRDHFYQKFFLEIFNRGYSNPAYLHSCCTPISRMFKGRW